jgi:hypothetical protein
MASHCDNVACLRKSRADLIDVSDAAEIIQFLVHAEFRHRLNNTPRGEAIVRGKQTIPVPCVYQQRNYQPREITYSVRAQIRMSNWLPFGCR